MLSIRNLTAKIGKKIILNDFNLEIKKGEVHALLGPNGSGKSTLSYVIAGKEGYEVDGEIIFKEKNILDISADERAKLGVFLAFQYPIEIPGVLMNTFLRTSLNSIKKAKGEKELDVVDFIKLSRPLNVGFSGGEKKRSEVLQMALLKPEIAILDETDSGLDIDALKMVANGINTLRDKERSFLVITHYQRLLDYLKPDFVHVIINGTIVKTGCSTLAEEIDRLGYKNFSSV